MLDKYSFLRLLALASILFSNRAFTQNDIALMFSLGSIRHYPMSSSENGRVKGSPAWDILPEVKVIIDVDPNTQVDVGGQNASLTSNFSINQTNVIEDSYATSKVLQSKSGY